MKRVINAARAFRDVAKIKLSGKMGSDPGSRLPFSPRILVFGYMGIGDLIVLAPALQALKAKWPSARLTLLTGPYSAAGSTAPLLPVFDEVIGMDWKKAGPDQKKVFETDLRERKFEAVLATYTAPIRFFFSALAYVPVRIGALRNIPYPKPFLHPVRALQWNLRLALLEEEYFKRRFFNRTIAVDQSGEHERDKNRRLVEKLAGPIGKLPDLDLRVPELSPSISSDLSKFTSGQKLIVVHPSVSPGQEWKSWPVEKFRSFVEGLLKSTNGVVVTVGSKDESKAIEAAWRDLPKDRVKNLMGTSVADMAAVIKRAALFVGGDSGPGHLALGIGTPAVRIFGPSDQQGYGAWGSGPHRDVVVDISCRPCVASGVEHPGALNYKNCGHHNCLNTLEPETVLKACIDLLRV